MYNIADIVVVIDPGETYSSYKFMFEKLTLKNKIDNPSFSKGTIAQIFAFAQHPTQFTNCIAIRDLEGKECVIGERGLRIATPEEKIEFYSTYKKEQLAKIPTIKLKRFQINII